MRSVKPGRGPSLMGGVGAVFAALFGIIWIVAASSMGAPPFFALFGVIFVLLAAASAVYNFYNAAARNRMSVLDVTTGEEEPDPIAQAMGYAGEAAQAESSDDPGRPADGSRQFPGEYCPFCGAKVSADFDYCPKCGKDI